VVPEIWSLNHEEMMDKRLLKYLTIMGWEKGGKKGETGEGKNRLIEIWGGRKRRVKRPGRREQTVK